MAQTGSYKRAPDGCRFDPEALKEESLYDLALLPLGFVR
jgi:hypothetical protein